MYFFLPKINTVVPYNINSCVPCLTLFSCIKWSPLLKISCVHKGRIHASLFNILNDRVHKANCAVAWYADPRGRLVTLHLVFSPLRKALNFGRRKYVLY